MAVEFGDCCTVFRGILELGRRKQNLQNKKFNFDLAKNREIFGPSEAKAAEGGRASRAKNFPVFRRARLRRARRKTDTHERPTASAMYATKIIYVSLFNLKIFNEKDSVFLKKSASSREKGKFSE